MDPLASPMNGPLNLPPRALIATRTHGRTAGFRAVAKVPAVVLLASLAAAHGQPRPSEYEVKAAYLLNFGKFLRGSQPVEGRERTTFNLCVLGRDPMGQSLDAITRSEQIDGRAVQVHRVHEGAEVRNCDVVYISADEGARIEPELASLHGAPILTVSDAAGFLAHGGMIQFVLSSNHVRFSVNLDAVRFSHLVLSSELLRVAVAVQGSPTGEVVP